MSGLSDLKLEMFDRQPRPEDQLLRYKTTRRGEKILICSKHPAPEKAIREAEQIGLPLFTTREVALMRDIDEQSALVVLDIKKIFPGSDVVKVMSEAPTA